MIRTVIGGLVGGIILFVIGFVFWATPLSELAFSRAGDAEGAAVQSALAQHLTKTGTGTYEIPYAGTAQGTTLYGKGPIATVHFNTSGFSSEDMGMLLPGFIVAAVTGLLIAFALAAVGGGRDFAGLARLVVLYSLGFTTWAYLATPIFAHHGWGHWIYAFVAESVSLILAGLVIARWFVPNRHQAQAAAPPHGHPE
ncbi:MAG TPA: hypothetical protein VF759_17230 [Allosphingosinicella sp.]|jgi:hypothetical protein